MQIFYCPDIAEGSLCFNEVESKHAIRVLRLKNGDNVHIIDGKGGLYHAQISNADPRKCAYEILDIQREFEKRPYYLHIAIAPTKNIDRFEWFLEKATEIGIDEITPLLCDNSERKIIKPERLEKIMISATKQSLKAYVPRLNPLTHFKDFVHQAFSGTKLLAHCYDSPKTTLKSGLNDNHFLIAIGPEGDFSINEVNESKQCDFISASLGSSRLRTETAGVVAAHTVNLLLS